MTYARARLILGMTTVGSLVLVSAAGLVFQVPARLIPSEMGSVPGGVASFVVFFLLYAAFMFPFDFCGGYLLPVREGRVSAVMKPYLRRWAIATTLQGLFFVGAATIILVAGKSLGLPGALFVVFGLSILILGLQQVAMLRPKRRSSACNGELTGQIRSRLKAWRIELPSIAFVRHADVGFTGGIVGFPGRETIVMPAKWFGALDINQLAAVVARRALAVRDGSRTFGLLLALSWNLTGFCVAAHLPGGGVGAADQILTTCLGFVIWSFLGLLLLPSVSRAAAICLDERTLAKGIPRQLLTTAFAKLDRMQDDEPSRPAIVETVFHPVPSVSRRMGLAASKNLTRIPAWNVCRTTLPLSWSCMGLLARAVHCNVGRPELWLLLPVD